MITKQIPKVYRPKRKSRSREKIKKNEALIIVYLNALMVEFSARIFGAQENFGGGGSQSSSSFPSPKNLNCVHIVLHLINIMSIIK